MPMRGGRVMPGGMTALAGHTDGGKCCELLLRSTVRRHNGTERDLANQRERGDQELEQPRPVPEAAQHVRSL